MRVLVTLSTVLVTLGVALWALVTYGSPTAIESGRRLYPERNAAMALATAARGSRPAVVWLGDSTLMGAGAYPGLIQGSHLQPHGLRSKVVTSEGLDAYAFYSLTWQTLALHPRVVVLIANLRVFGVGGATTHTFDELTAFVPTGALPDLLGLPFHLRGMTAPGLLLTRTLRYDWARDAFFWLQGTRDEIQHAAAWTVLGPEKPRRATDAARNWVVGVRRVAEAYNEPITPRQPLLRFLAASVSEFSAAGARALVVVTPIPHTWLAKLGRYDPEAFAARIDVLRRAVEAEGGTLLDLHDALEPSLFRDRAGHFTAAGNEQMQRLVWPVLSRLLG